MSIPINLVEKNIPAAIQPADEIVWHNVRLAPFDLYGLYRPQIEPVFRRMPLSVASAVNPEVRRLHTNTSGGRVRFCTDSPFIALRTRMKEKCLVPHMTLLGSSGFDLYEQREEHYTFLAAFQPPVDFVGGYEVSIDLKSTALRELLLNMPLYNGLESLSIGLKKGAFLEHGQRYLSEKPLVFYGSSITQGACVSRPGLMYPAILSRRFNRDYLDLGFSGSAKAEESMTEYLCTLPAEVFILDYDHNAPDEQYLAATHERLFTAYRASHPQTPVIFASRPDFDFDSSSARRREVIRATWQHARQRGDNHVYFLDGESFYGTHGRGDCTVEGCHPNDIGHRCMAEAFAKVLAPLLEH